MTIAVDLGRKEQNKQTNKYVGLYRNLVGQSSFGNAGAQWLSGKVLDSRLKGSGFEPHRRHCVVVLEQDTFILA